MIKTIIIFTYLIVSAIILLPIGFVAQILSYLGMKKPMYYVIYKIAQGWALVCIKMTGCPTTITGMENIPKTGGICFVSNHEGLFDIVMVLAYLGRPFGFIAKKELLMIPVLNIWISMLGGLFIDRKNIRKAIKTIEKGINKIKNGGSMIIFPEGHRSKGRGLLPFHPGSLKLATQAQAPIVPMAISGGYDVFEKNSRATKTHLKVHFCESINTADLSAQEKKQILSEKIRTQINEKLGFVPLP